MLPTSIAHAFIAAFRGTPLFVVAEDSENADAPETLDAIER